jgi:hypothetical protein
MQDEPHDEPHDDPMVPEFWSPPPPAPARRRRGRWLVIGGVALALALTLGVGMLLGSALHPSAQAASNTGQGLFQAGQGAGPFLGDGPRFPLAGTPGAQGPCDAYTVSSVSGQTITAKAADGTSVTIHTTSSTTYTKAGQAATASAVTVGSQIHVQGTHNSDGSITATSIDVG